MADDNRTFAEILGPEKVAELMSYAAAADDLVDAVVAYAMRTGQQPLDALENLLPMVRAALADQVPIATNLAC